jgi:hypothetical protein
MEKTILNLQQGDKVEYDNGAMRGQGEVVGIATTPLAVIGASVIIRDLSKNIPNESYPFECFVCSECHLRKNP